MTEYVPEEPARRAGGDGGLEREDSSDSGKNARVDRQTLFSICFQNVGYRSHVNQVSVLWWVWYRRYNSCSEFFKQNHESQVEMCSPIRPDLHPRSESISEPSEYFSKFFDETTMECIAEQSNLYAVQTNPSKPPMLTCKELEIFLVFYWKCPCVLCLACACIGSKNLSIQYVNILMTSVRFEHITKYFHFNDNSKMVARGEENFDKLFKIRPPITHLQSKFRDVLTFSWKRVYFALNS